ncbi:MAG: Fic family protein, partial [Acidimicrobiia bacterium]
MAEFVRRRWEPGFEGLSRRDRKGCFYDTYLPDPLSAWSLSLPADLAADVADAETAVRDLNRDLVSLEGLARFLLRAESVASSKIEGLEAGARRLVEAEALLAQSGEKSDRLAVEILGNISSMQAAIDLADRVGELTVDDLAEIHRILMSSSSRPEIGGVVRTEQNWIGGSSYNPCSASFVPPPPEHVEDLLRDLMDYVNGDEHPALVQAAIAHAQFETIHPFADGNGRTGRALIHVVLRRRGLATSFVPPISLVLATWSADYISGLTAFRHTAAADSPERSEAAQPWVRVFAAATRRGCHDAESYADRIEQLIARWRDTVGPLRTDSAAELLIGVLPGVPLITVESASRLVGRSKVAASAAVNRLVDAGILVQRNIGKQRYRVFEAPDVLDLFTALERGLA